MQSVIFDVRTSDLISAKGQIIMSSSEQPYMAMLVSALAGVELTSVFEIGFGLGISAGLIQRTLRPKRHVIAEIDAHIYEDCKKFSASHVGVETFGGDFMHYRGPGNFDLVFYDSYDYTLLTEEPLSSEVSTACIAPAELSFIRQLLSSRGYLAFPYFGDMDMPSLEGFALEYLGRYSGPAFLLWDGSACASGQIGRYRYHS